MINRALTKMPWTDLVLRLGEILIETRSARSKILAVKLAHSLKLRSVSTIGDGDQVQACSKLARLTQKFWLS